MQALIVNDPIDSPLARITRHIELNGHHFVATGERIEGLSADGLVGVRCRQPEATSLVQALKADGIAGGEVFAQGVYAPDHIMSPTSIGRWSGQNQRMVGQIGHP
jgi:hypothetical protein